MADLISLKLNYIEKEDSYPSLTVGYVLLIYAADALYISPYVV